MVSATSFLSSRLRGKQISGLKELLAELREYLTDEQVEGALATFEFAADAHTGQTRMSGEPYITHPVAVARILAELRLDYPSIVAALLHDVIEDTPTAKEQIEQRFGAQVAAVVDGVSKLDQIEFNTKAEAQAESFRKMFLAVADDIRVIVVKLADRLHNMRTLGAMPREKQRKKAVETLEIYAPIANRLGINSMRMELEDLGFQALYPMRYKVIHKNIKKMVGSRRHMLRKVTSALSEAMVHHHVVADVSGRSKDPYSIYMKMKKKGRALSEIIDVFGFRITVQSVDECYRTIGVVHKTYKPMPGRFKDYIAIPKVNGYQSLHTTLFGPKGVPIEVQIRTEDMEKVAESGIASHWLYKSDGADMGPESRAREWLRGLMELQERTDSEEFVESVKLDLFPDKVYVFTPKGDIKRLPRGATAVDFAYALHTDIGNRCASVKIDRRQMPLRTPLESGQTVEVMTSRMAKPDATWLNFVVTAKARSAIRHYLKNLRRGEAATLGKRLLTVALANMSLNLKRIPKKNWENLLDELALESRDSVFEQIGLGQQLAPLLARRLARDKADPLDVLHPANAALSIQGTEGMVVQYAKCCLAIPGDTIIGYLSAGRGIVIHRDVCKNLEQYRKDPQKWVQVEWQEETQREFAAEICVESTNRMGVLAEVAARISDTETNIKHVSVTEREGDTSSLVFQLQISGRKQLARVMRSVRAMNDVIKVTRTCN